MTSDIETLIRKLALKNAVEHEGQAKADAVISKIMGIRPDLRKNAKAILAEIRAIVDDVNKMNVGEQRRELEKIAPEMLQEHRDKESRLPPLPNAESGKVITRFPPEPNGYPHIGHAKAVILDEEYARMYKGKLILRFDDTNPLQEKIEYYHAIKEGLDWLNVKPDLIKNTSDDMELLYEYAKRMIEIESAYVCICEAERIRENRKLCMECPCRSNNLDTNLEKWEKMFKEYKQNEAILRYKGDMKSENTVMRDPTLFRIIDAEHPLKGRKYRVWPTYDFAAPIEDSIDGVTHAMRTKEYELRNELYYAIIERLNIRRPIMIEFSRLEFEGMPVSKRKIRPLIEEGLVEGWDDPRLPTLKGLRRRGITPEAIREFVLTLGFTKADTKPPFDVLEAINRRMLDPITRRLFFVRNPVLLHIRNAPEKTVRIKNHPEKDLGVREIFTTNQFYIDENDARRLSPETKFRLLELYNVRVESIEPDRIIGEYAGSEIEQDIPKIQWVSIKDCIKARVLIPKALYIDESYNEASLEIVEGYADSHISKLKKGERVQFVRFGFCILDTDSTLIFTHK